MGRPCEGDLRAQVGGGKLTLRHGMIPCPRQGTTSLVPEVIECRTDGDAGGGAKCDAESLGKMKGGFKGEKFNRVSNEHCNWQPPR